MQVVSHEYWGSGRLVREEQKGQGGTGTYLLPDQVGVVDDAHDRRKAHGALVDGLQEVGRDHDGEDALVDQPPEALVFLWRDLDAGVRHVRRQLLVHPAEVLEA